MGDLLCGTVLLRDVSSNKMTRFIHDEFAKDYLEGLLKPYGKVKSDSRVASEVRKIDVLFYP